MIDLARQPGRLALVVLAAAALLASPAAALAQAGSTSARSHKKPARAKAPAPAHGADAEARLLQVYALTRAGHAAKALEQAQALVRDYPNFHLAQLTLGDLLSARMRPLRQLGDVSAPAADAALQELRTESRQRVAAHARLAQRTPGSVPSQFLQLAPRYRHAIAVDASLSRLYLFENTPAGLQLVADYYASVGKLGIEKSSEGDQRTPLGVYFITARLDPATLQDIYGIGALPLNYPNALDQARGKTGSGIWLHGTPSNQFARAPLATDGCVALSNPDLARLLQSVEPRTTPVVIASALQWQAPAAQQSERERREFQAVLDDWSRAKTRGNLQQLISYYAPDFRARKNRVELGLSDWALELQNETAALAGRALQLKELSLLRWVDTHETMVVTFGEVAQGERTGPVRRQYWTRQGTQWRIFYEGIIG
ncbi:murein L,D-transpeptidase family protein [Comamonas sp. NLF-1-9]|uniref:L,D-transpeptidase family protein n=1 Tax=Comamonas sp. NLF-1-9 TaxID=2853163 RepID=UPI001C44F0BF|nr:L,D-transpeptidase [Comamonas sp. NLF-1-9]QXL83280.1 L,D-transpeptidase [Comamonas sp. NLF-1-9]